MIHDLAASESKITLVLSIFSNRKFCESIQHLIMDSVIQCIELMNVIVVKIDVTGVEINQG